MLCGLPGGQEDSQLPSPLSEYSHPLRIDAGRPPPHATTVNLLTPYPETHAGVFDIKERHVAASRGDVGRAYKVGSIEI